MKKTLKVLLLVAFMSVVLLALTGCGNKLVATRETEEDGMKVEEKIEISFKKDKVNKVKMTYKFDTEENAELMAGIFKMGMAMSEEDMGFEVEQKGKKVVIELDAKAYAEMSGEEVSEVSKEELKKQLKEDGYKVK